MVMSVETNMIGIILVIQVSVQASQHHMQAYRSLQVRCNLGSLLIQNTALSDFGQYFLVD